MRWKKEIESGEENVTQDTLEERMMNLQSKLGNGKEKSQAVKCT